MIQGVHAIRDIEKGEELLTDYGYNPAPFPGDHPWYHEAKKEMLKEKQNSNSVI